MSSCWDVTCDDIFSEVSVIGRAIEPCSAATSAYRDVAGRFTLQSIAPKRQVYLDTVHCYSLKNSVNGSPRRLQMRGKVCG